MQVAVGSYDEQQFGEKKEVGVCSPATHLPLSDAPEGDVSLRGSQSGP